MNYIAALYTHGRVVTGCNHGDAFGKLTADEQGDDLVSGFLDVDTGKFITEGEHGFYLKHLVLVRHAEPMADEVDPPSTEDGQHQIESAAGCLALHDLSEYTGFTSPILRCRQTAEILASITHITFAVEDDIREWGDGEELVDFHRRIEKVLCHLPPKSILVSHCDFILHSAYLATGESLNCQNRHIPPGSLTIIHDDKIVCMGEFAENQKGMLL